MSTTSPEHVHLPSRYAIQRPLGAGGMATVFLVHDSMLGVNRAVKVLNKDLVARANIQRRFSREARTMAQIRHPNVVTVFDVIQTDAVSAIVMDFVAGGSLHDLLEMRGMLETEEALAVMHEVAAGVEAAHSFGVIHRDIKPHNILLEPSGVPKLSDFGIARQLEQSHGFTRTGAVLGTMAFMAPEQRGGLDTIDLRADVYALGATLYVLVTGRTPFDLYAKEFHQRLFDGVPAVLAAIVKKACSFRPEDRHDSARDFADHIREVLVADVEVASLLPRPDSRPPIEAPAALTTNYDPTFAFDSLHEHDSGSHAFQLNSGSRNSDMEASPSLSEGNGWWDDSAASAQTPPLPPEDASRASPPGGPPAAVPAAAPVSTDTMAEGMAEGLPPTSSLSRRRAPLVALALVPMMLAGLWWALSARTEPASMGGGAVPTPPSIQHPEATPPAPTGIADAPVDAGEEPSAAAATAPLPPDSPPEASTAPEPGSPPESPHTATAPASRADEAPARRAPSKIRREAPAPPPTAPPDAPEPAAETAPEVARRGTVVINSVPAGRYTVAGRSGNTPEFGLELPEGAHTIQFTHTDGTSGTTTVRVRADDTARVCWSFADSAPCAY